MRVAVIDVGSNTVRLLVADGGPSAVWPVHEERALLALGDEIERFGRISDLKLAEAAERARRYARLARELRCTSTAVIVTAPGRQAANAGTLVEVLERATGSAARVLSPEDEGRLAFAGALVHADPRSGALAVCDVGGGSTELVVGDPTGGPAFCRSFELGSLRLSRRFLDDDPPGKRSIRRARAEVERRLGDLAPPASAAALATGGSARSLRKVAGTRLLDEDALAGVLRVAARRTAARIAREHGLDPMRARTLLAGTLILAGAQRRIGAPLEVARGGLREGAAVALLAQLAAA